MRKYTHRLLVAALSILLLAFNPRNSQSQGNQDASNIILEVEQKADVTGNDGELHVVLKGRYRIVRAKEIAPNRQQYPGEVKDGDAFRVYLRYLGGQMVEGSASGGGRSVKLYDCSKPEKVYWQGAGQGHVEDKLANLGRIQGPLSDGSISLDVRAGNFSFSPCDNPMAPQQDGVEFAEACWQDQWPVATISYSDLHKLDKLDRTWTGSPALDLPGCHSSISLHIRAIGAEDVEVVLIPQEGYDKWMPIAGLNEDKAGNQLRVKVELRKKGTDQKPLWTTANKFTFQLVDTSHQPGTCLNWPPPEQTKWPADFDFKIDKDQNPDLDVNPDGQSATSKKPDLQQMSIWISSYDWGGWSKLQVSADLSNGQKNVAAELEGRPGVKEVSIPKDDNNNHVADAWEVTGEPTDAMADEDSSPTGDHNGDVLSYYEEYRGFHTSSQITPVPYIEGRTLDRNHVRTDPGRKDIFIYDKGNLGLGYFAASGMAIHGLQKDEFTKVDVNDPKKENSLVVNFNYGYAHLGDDKPNMHVIQLNNGVPPDDPGRLGEVYPAGDPRTPKSAVAVYINRDGLLACKFQDKELKNEIGHELAHACFVKHHGDDDYEAAEIFQSVTGGQFKPMQTPCGLTKGGTPANCYVSVPQGQFSGPMQCIMRYHGSNGYYVQANGPFQWKDKNGQWVYGDLYGPTEEPGNVFCTRQDNSSSSNIRFGPALTGRGNCSEQFCVNDLKH
jgi:hypothetical protein